MVSVKTIEYHLSNVYAKLGGITRRQLRPTLDDLYQPASDEQNQQQSAAT